MTLRGRDVPQTALGYRTRKRFAQQWKGASPSCLINTAEGQSPQGNPNGLRCAPALTRLPLCLKNSIQEGEAKNDLS